MSALCTHSSDLQLQTDCCSEQQACNTANSEYLHTKLRFTVRVELAANPVNQGMAVACTARRQPNRLQSNHSAISHYLLDCPEQITSSYPLPATKGHMGESNKAESKLAQSCGAHPNCVRSPSRLNQGGHQHTIYQS